MSPASDASGIGVAAIGIDVGGTTIKGLRFAASGAVEAEFRLPTPSPDPTGERVVEAVARVVAGLGGAPGTPVGLVVPGIVDEARGLAVWSANVGFRDVPLRSLASARLGVDVAFGQDVRAGALAEIRSGAARSVTGDVAFVPVGTGIAAALFVDGRMLVSGGWAGEIGQSVLVSGPHAGLRVEEVASASATARRAGEPDALSVARRVESGDGAAAAVWAETVAVLADALAGLVVAVAPQTIVIGGGLAQAGALLLDPLGVELRRRLGTLRSPALVAAGHGDLAAAIGAALLAVDQHLSAMQHDAEPQHPEAPDSTGPES
jgi:glucokinase